MMSPGESRHQTWSDGKFQYDKFVKWLELEQKVLQKIFLIILFTGGGISPWTLSISELQYREIASGGRNLCFHNGSLCFAFPRAKKNSQSKGDISHSLYAFPPQLNWPLSIYLGIIQQFTIQVMKENNWSLGKLEEHLFVYTKSGAMCGFAWKASYMNVVLGNFSKSLFGSSFRVPDFCQVTQAIYEFYADEMVYCVACSKAWY